VDAILPFPVLPGVGYSTLSLPTITLSPDTISSLCQPTGTIQHQPPISNIHIFPNPADDEFTVSGSQFPIQKIEILNLLGETVFSKELPATGIHRMTSSHPMNVRLPSSIYIIKVYADEGVFQRKLVINH
jgi:hypothetical protein